ncbi:MAG: PD-(D/E)XK nuclease family protein [Thaumarchaeota archaeon]|nr:PD-(D/E)XK nuclease family protein [Nitrososphaerota archaeon]
MTWEESLEKSLHRSASSRPLRHGISAVPVSSLASQYYCEQKVELAYIHGDVETESKIEGTELHEELIPMEEATHDEIVTGIKKELFIASFPISASLSGLRLAGIPDAVVFQKSIPSFVIELKTTNGDTSKLWKDQLVQTEIYGLILDEMGFDCSGLKLVIGRLWKNGNISESYKEKFLGMTVESLLGQKRHNLNTKRFTAHIVDYDRKDSLNQVEWARDYWLGSRNAIPTKNENKCRACEYGNLCDFNLARRN